MDSFDHDAVGSTNQTNQTNQHYNDHGGTNNHSNNQWNNHNMPTTGILVQKGSVYSCISVRTLCRSDLPFVETWRNMEELQQYFIYQIPVNKRLLTRWFETMDKTKNHYYVIELHNNNHNNNQDSNQDSRAEHTNNSHAIPIGVVSVSKIEDAHSDKPKSGIVGLYIAYSQFRGKGIAQAVMNYIHHLYFHEKGLEQIEACIHDHNKRSQKFFAKMGYTKQTVECNHHLHQVAQKHCLEVVAIRKEDWQGSRET